MRSLASYPLPTSINTVEPMPRSVQPKMLLKNPGLYLPMMKKHKRQPTSHPDFCPTNDDLFYHTPIPGDSEPFPSPSAELAQYDLPLLLPPPSPPPYDEDHGTKPGFEEMLRKRSTIRRPSSCGELGLTREVTIKPGQPSEAERDAKRQGHESQREDMGGEDEGGPVRTCGPAHATEHLHNDGENRGSLKRCNTAIRIKSPTTLSDTPTVESTYPHPPPSNISSEASTPRPRSWVRDNSYQSSPQPQPTELDYAPSKHSMDEVSPPRRPDQVPHTKPMQPYPPAEIPEHDAWDWAPDLNTNTSQVSVNTVSPIPYSSVPEAAVGVQSQPSHPHLPNPLAHYKKSEDDLCWISKHGNYPMRDA